MAAAATGERGHEPGHDGDPQRRTAMSAPRRVDVAIVGGGQAGLALSWCLSRDGVDHVVLEAGTACHTWSDARWDSFTLVTPNWHCRLPGFAYDGEDPDGFMTREQVVAWLARYRASFDPPLLEGHRVRGLRPGDPGAGEQGFRFTVDGPDGEREWQAREVVVATGGYQHPVIPGWAAGLDPSVTQLHSALYRNPDQLPEGGVLVVGTGQSGAQIAEDLHLAGRSVHLAVGKAPRVARRHRGRDVMTWLAEMGLYDIPVAAYPGGPAAREKTNHYVTGRDGGRDIDLRRFAAEGMHLYGTLTGLVDGAGTRVGFAPTLRAHLDAADDVYRSICRDIDAHILRQGVDAPPAPPYEPVWEPAEEPCQLDLVAAGVTSVVWAIGFRPDYSWIGASVFDGAGRPVHVRGVTTVPGLSFLGLPWQHTWGSGRFLGIAADAEHLTATVGARLRAGRRTGGPLASVILAG
ncbi:MAG: MSMEG_0569 family flavin-dependent oxidoreductase [Kineosporiaceae bacterium]